MRVAGPLLPLLLALVAWAPALRARGFSYDDREALEANPVVEGSVPWTAAFRYDYWHHLEDAGMYRPLVSLSLRADRARFGERVAGYHAHNLLLHLGVVGLGVGLALTALARPAPALFGLAVFAVHPLLADAVAWISGRSSMLSALGGLAGALAVASATRAGDGTRHRAAAALGAGVGLFVALCAKEDGLFFAPLFLLLAARRSRAALAWTLAGALGGFALYAALRAQALGSAWPSATHAPFAGAPALARANAAGRALLEAARLVFWPRAYPPNYRAAPGFDGSAPWSLALFGWSVVAALAAVAVRLLARAGAKPGGGAARRRAASYGLLLALAAWTPFLQLAPAGEVFAPRFLYLPLLFSAPAVGLVLAPLSRPAVAALLVALVGAAWSRTRVYADAESYVHAVLTEVPDDAAAWNGLGLAREAAGDLPGALAAWEQGLALAPEHSRLWSNLGRVALAAGDLEAAERAFRRAVRVGPRNPIAHVNLGALLLRTERPALAEAAYAEACALAPGLVAAWRGLAHARFERDELPAARVALDAALALDPCDPGARALAERMDTRERGAGAAAYEAAGSEP